MKLLTLTTIAAALAVTLAPAAAKSKKHHRMHHPEYSQMQRGGGYAGYGGGFNRGYGYGGGWNSGYGGWNNRNVSDPSLGHPSAAEVSRWNGRCVEDLGYGRYEACGW
jgi:hypothetical protein